jgi:hypothetical protein
LPDTMRPGRYEMQETVIIRFHPVMRAKPGA